MILKLPILDLQCTRPQCCTSSQLSQCLQLYVNGELVGGADIVEEMHGKGELKDLLLSS